MAKDPVCNMMVDEKKAQHIRSKWTKSLFVFSTLQKSV
jgi:YHS domain-containing protein